MRTLELRKQCQTNYWRHPMANGWTSQRQARQAELLRRLRPWERSTGPRTAEGKARTSRNAFKGGTRQRLRALARQVNFALREQRSMLREWGQSM